MSNWEIIGLGIGVALLAVGMAAGFLTVFFLLLDADDMGQRTRGDGR